MTCNVYASLTARRVQSGFLAVPCAEPQARLPLGQLRRWGRGVKGGGKQGTPHGVAQGTRQRKDRCLIAARPR